MALSATSGPPLPPPGAGSAAAPGATTTGPSGLIAGARATPMPEAAPLVGGGAVAAATAGTGGLSMDVMASLTSMLTMVIGMLAAQQGAAGVSGGGAVGPGSSVPPGANGAPMAPPPPGQSGSSGVPGVAGGGPTSSPTGGVSSFPSVSVVAVDGGTLQGPSTVGGSFTDNPSGWSIVGADSANGPVSPAVGTVPVINVTPPVGSGSVVGGGALPAPPVVLPPAAPGDLPPALPGATSTVGGGSFDYGLGTALAMSGVSSGIGGGGVVGGFSNDWSLVQSTGGTVAPAATTGGGARAGAVAAEPDAPAGTQLDMRRVLGTPLPGDAIATIIASAKVSAMPAMGEGTWRVLLDGGGAQMQVHAHGRWATAAPAEITAGIKAGQIAVHLHADGTAHLHDIM